MGFLVVNNFLVVIIFFLIVEGLLGLLERKMLLGLYWRILVVEVLVGIIII